jgi:hypothetical protein
MSKCPNCGCEIDGETPFTQSDIKKMSLEEYEANREKIMEQLSKGMIR